MSEIQRASLSVIIAIVLIVIAFWFDYCVEGDRKMREKHTFGKRTNKGNKVPSDKVLKETFGVVNNGCDSQQIVDYIRKTTSHTIKGEE